jgi:hypothetical protein
MNATEKNKDALLQEARARIGELEKELVHAKLCWNGCRDIAQRNWNRYELHYAKQLEAEAALSKAQARIQELEKPVEDEEVAKLEADLRTGHPGRFEQGIDYALDKALPIIRRLSLQVKEGRADALEEAEAAIVAVSENVEADSDPLYINGWDAACELASTTIRALLPKG